MKIKFGLDRAGRPSSGEAQATKRGGGRKILDPTVPVFGSPRKRPGGEKGEKYKLSPHERQAGFLPILNLSTTQRGGEKSGVS